jgi:hypothetical protein
MTHLLVEFRILEDEFEVEQRYSKREVSGYWSQIELITCVDIRYYCCYPVAICRPILDL